MSLVEEVGRRGVSGGGSFIGVKGVDLVVWWVGLSVIVLWSYFFCSFVIEVFG